MLDDQFCRRLAELRIKKGVSRQGYESVDRTERGLYQQY